MIRHYGQRIVDVELITKGSTVVKGDEVVTSYISDKYLLGLLIGYISDVTENDTEPTLSAKPTPILIPAFVQCPCY